MRVVGDSVTDCPVTFVGASGGVGYTAAGGLPPIPENAPQPIQYAFDPPWQMAAPAPGGNGCLQPVTSFIDCDDADMAITGKLKFMTFGSATRTSMLLVPRLAHCVQRV